jgi:hypothetical protein
MTPWMMGTTNGHWKTTTGTSLAGWKPFWRTTIIETFGILEITMTRQPTEPLTGNDPNSISFDEFIKYLTGYSSYEQLADEMSKGKEKP